MKVDRGRSESFARVLICSAGGAWEIYIIISKVAA